MLDHPLAAPLAPHVRVAQLASPLRLVLLLVPEQHKLDYSARRAVSRSPLAPHTHARAPSFLSICASLVWSGPRAQLALPAPVLPRASRSPLAPHAHLVLLELVTRREVCTNDIRVHVCGLDAKPHPSHTQNICQLI